MKKYIRFPMPVSTYKNWKEKQIKMNLTVKNLTGKNRTIPLSYILEEASKKPLWLKDTELMELSMKLSNKRRRR